ncbi:hypothetical protein HER32_04120 [Hymenobacter sp. BT18]|uniref:DUF5958 family protein n=1 Tax=Hymenobacter sp. BT18 TaxID=2835648 RepID=UPI00143E36C9|nr:DUF5958 family protein [Hymenobacter sp. BT18]QIX60417.1 hypothetical protein HER32_04120 [Hymenobacter sp. BT18]
MPLIPDHLLNRLAQQQLPWGWAWVWFAALPVAAQQAQLAELASYIQQAHPNPTPALVQQAVAEAPMKPTATPLVLLRVHPLPQALTSIQQLPASEYPNAFRALLSVFRVADDDRRRTQCQHGCSHDWHNLPPAPYHSDRLTLPFWYGAWHRDN